MTTIPQNNSKPHGMAYWFVPALGALLSWGLWSFIPKIAIQTISPATTLFYVAVGDVLVILPMFLFVMKGKVQTSRKGVTITFIASALTVGSMLAYFTALHSDGRVAVIATITAMYPAITVLLARVFLREKINRRQLLALVMALAAIILLAG